MVDCMRRGYRLYLCSHLPWQVEAKECSRAGGMPVSEESHLVPLPSMLNSLRSMNCGIDVEVIEVDALTGDVRRKCSFGLQLLEGLLDDKARPMCCNSVSRASSHFRSCLETRHLTITLFLAIELSVASKEAV